MINTISYEIFKKGSKTYFYSSVFFPLTVRNRVFVLYGFVRKADNFVDDIPQDSEGFYKFKNDYYRSLNGEKVGDVVIDSFVKLIKKFDIEREWVDSFLKSMEMDLNKKTYKNLDETIEYMYGSAEVIGMMMCKIMGLSKESYNYAKNLGRAMQFINFIRDINEDNQLGRLYLPLESLKKYDLDSLLYEEVSKKEKNFKLFLREQLDLYFKWQKVGERGFRFIPNYLIVPIKTASDMYKYTAKKIYEDPFIVYRVKVKPRIRRILLTGLFNFIDAF
ncbi:MAG: phytoene/squalene synthase family protein [bacterium]|uniref:Phytoene/squalene synthetase n=2 Tax=Bacteria candidate phyla TaxID=1783234 RepID=A0A124G0B6_UNCT6|nr:MAG: Phytoene/squalene synthetase [candidate division TA06 bacterium 32_111]KUK86862.1 MAG: Phytoene/squalene synthetase [candidate division TA06 bacterium 34_109]MDI6700749.1 phytoene/squalene synthase family protein [bacterium]HAF07299.1 phytoene/squalene synthase family protein [candidate division WOR-3 bacterium]HCP16467.1 phytoene/squalene synthase family protein [candidate division WOR-3 bacterium]